MKTNLAGKIVLITGAAKGIGRATALAFAAEGSQLALLDWDEGALAELKHEVEALGAKAAVSKADLSTLSGVNDGIDSVLAIYDGKVDVLVNNVGSGAVRMFDDLTDEDWEATMQLNFMSYVRACRKILPVMRAQQSGVIINNASDLARQPEPCPLDYSASKAAVLAVTKGLARSEGPHIRVNAVAPGPIWTPFWTKSGGFAETMAKVHGMDPQAAVEQIGRAHV